MATAGSIGRRRALVIERIQNRCAAIGGGRELVIPTHSRFGQDLLLVFQLEAIADFLDAIELPPAEPTNTESEFDNLTNAQLKDMINARGLTVGKARSKPELIAVLTSAQETEDAPTL